MSRDLKYIVTAEDRSDAGWAAFRRKGGQAFGDMEQRAAASAQNMGGVLSAAIGGAFTAAGVAMFAANVVKSIDALNDAADATGSTIEKMSALDDFARRTGASLQDVTGVVLTLQKSLSKAGDDDTKGVGAALKAIGLEAEELRNIDPADAIKKVADALAKFDDGAGKTRAIQVLFKDAQTAAPLLKDLADQQELVGHVSKAQADEVDKLVKSWAQLSASGHSFAVGVGNEVIPAFNDIITFTRRAQAEYGAFAGSLVGLIGGGLLKSIGVELDESKRAATASAEAFKGLADARERLAKSQAAMANAPDLLKWAVSGNIERAKADVAKYTAELRAANSEVARLAKEAPRSAAAPQNTLTFDGPKATETGKAARAAKAEVDEFLKVLEKVQGLNMKNSGLDPAYWNDVETLFKGYQSGRVSLEKYQQAVDTLTTSQKFHSDAVAEAAKAAKEAEKAQADYYEAWSKYLGGLDEEADKLEEQAKQFGLSKTAIAQLTLARAEDRLEMARAAKVSEEYRQKHEEYLGKLEEEVEARRRIASATSSVEVAEANKKAADDAAAEWKRISDDVGRGLTDAIFEGGKDGWELLKKTIEAQVIRAVVQPAISNAINSGLQGVGLGQGGGGGSGASGNSWMGSASNLNTMSGFMNNASVAYQWYNGTMSGANATGTVIANTTGSGLDGLIGATEGWGTAPASSYAGVSGWGAAGGMLGGALLGYNATDGNALGTFAGGALGTAGYGAVSGAISGAGAYAGASTALAAIPVWGWIALAALAIGGSMVTGGTPHMGGAYVADSAGNSYAANSSNAPGFDLEWGAYGPDRFSGFDAVAQASATGIAAQAKTLIENFGGGSTLVTALAKFASDSDDYSQGAIRLFDATGKKIADLDKHYTEDANDAIKEWAADTPRVLLQALQNTDLADEFDALFATLDPLKASIEEINALFTQADRVQKVFALSSESALKTVEDNAMSSYTAFMRLGESLRAMARTGAYAADDMLAALTQRYNAEVQMLTSIGDLSLSVSAGFDDSLRSLRLSTLDNEGKYSFLDAEAARFSDMINSASDPEKIAEYGQSLLRTLDESLALLSDEQRKATQDEYEKRYIEAQDAIQARLDEAKQRVMEDQTSLAETIKQAVIDSYGAAAVILDKAGSTIPSQINITVDVISGSTEVGVYTDNAGG